MVFELDDAAMEAIMFAMENQEERAFVEMETGAIQVGTEEGPEDAEGGEVPAFEPIPAWTSQDGFRLMEQFSQSLGHPLARSDLLAALSRGRGVFRAFKNALEAHPEAVKKWYEYKSRAMKARIVQWYEELRDLRGLARLGLELEDTDDLLLSDFQIHCRGPEAWSDLAALIRAGREDALARFPEPLVEYEYAALGRDIAGDAAKEFSIYTAECESGIYAGAAIVRTLRTAERALEKLVYLYVDSARRRIGLGRTLTEFARDQTRRRGIRLFIVDVPFLWREFGDSLEPLGFEAFGTRWLSGVDA